MTSSMPRTDRPVRLGWAIKAASVLALLTAALQLLGLLIAVGSVPAQLTGNPVTVTIDTSQPIRSVGRNSYGGSAYIADATPVTMTQAQAQVRDLDVSVRIGLAFGPVVWSLTGVAVAFLLAQAFGRLARTPAGSKQASQGFVVIAAVVAVGTSIGQVLDDVARTGLQGVMWHGPQGMDHIGAGAGFTFQLGWLAAAVGALAIAAALARTTEVRPPAVGDPA